MPAYSRINAGIRISSTVVAMARAINTAGIITVIIPNLYAFIDRRSLCSGRIHYKITLKVCLQDGQVLSSI